MYYTGIGSRETPGHILGIMERLGAKLAVNGWVLRSGGAPGADSSFQKGCESVNGKKQIFIPWNGFSGIQEDRTMGIYCIKDSRLVSLAEKEVSTIHPIWDSLKRGPKALHTRNVFQVLGPDLDEESRMVVFYAQTVGNSVKGGTRTAVEVAKKYGVPLINLYIPEDLERVEKYLEV